MLKIGSVYSWETIITTFLIVPEPKFGPHQYFELNRKDLITILCFEKNVGRYQYVVTLFKNNKIFTIVMAEHQLHSLTEIC